MSPRKTRRIRACLILSKFAGAAAQLSDAVLVNPYDINDMTQGFVRHSKCRWKSGSHDMRNSASVVHECDSTAWSSSYYSALVKAGERRLGRTAAIFPKNE